MGAGVKDGMDRYLNSEPDNASTGPEGSPHCRRPSVKKEKNWAHRNRGFAVAKSYPVAQFTQSSPMS